MTELTSDELYLAAFANPENFKGDKLERLLFQRQLVLAARIRAKIGSSTSQTAQLAKLLLDKPIIQKHASTHVDPRDKIIVRMEKGTTMQIPDEAISRTTDLLERLYQILQIES